MEIGWPGVLAVKLSSFDRAHIRHQGIKPDVDDVLVLTGHGNAPGNRCTGDRKVLEPLLNESDDFVAAGFGLYKIGLLLIKLEQLVPELRELEKIVLFGDLLKGAAAQRARLTGLAIGGVELV